MKYIQSILLTLVITLFLVGCDSRPAYQKKTHQTVAVYKQHNPKYVKDSTDNEWLYWYVLFYNNSYYSYQSPTYVTDPKQYSTFTWTKSTANPIYSVVTDTIEVLDATSVPNSELGSQMSQTIDTTEAQISSDGGADMSASESVSSDGGSDSSASTGGDSGGGDAGGGD